MKRILMMAAVICVLSSCDKNNPPEKTEGATKITPYYLLNEGDDEFNSHAGETSRSTLTYVGGTFRYLLRDVTNMDMSVYPRFIKTTDGRYLMFYHNGEYDSANASYSWAGSHCAYAESDDMLNWKYCGPIFSLQKNVQGEYGDLITRAYSGAYPVRLNDGRIMVVTSYRRVSDYRNKVLDNGLAFKFSSDEGRTWTTTELRINVGTNWEPCALVLPQWSDHPGRVIVYYTDSSLWIPKHSVGQWPENSVVGTGVSYIYSDDNGKMWQPDNWQTNHLFAYRQLRQAINGYMIYTDQMPGVINLNCSKQLVGTGESAMEVAGVTDHQYHISLSYGEMDGSWGSPDADGVLPRKRINAYCKGLAPQIFQFPSGEVIWTYNTVLNGRQSLFYRIGDENAENFTDRTMFFTTAPNAGNSPAGCGFWGSILIDGHVMLAGVGGLGGEVGLNFGMQVGQYYLNHNITASSHEFKVDGNNDEWRTTDQALYLGSKENVNATLRASVSGGKLGILVEISGSGSNAGDYAQVYFASPSAGNLSAGDIFVKVGENGAVRTAKYKTGWFTEELDVQTSVAKLDGAYLVEMSIPLSLFPALDGEVLVNLQVNDKADGVQSIIDMDGTATDKWMKIKNLYK